MVRWVLAALGLVALTVVVAASALADRAWGLTAPPAGLTAALAGSRSDARDPSTNEKLMTLTADNARLRARLADYQAVPGEDILARWETVGRGAIAARSSRLGRRYVELDLGADQGATPGMAVMAGGALIGLVAGIRPGRSLVQLMSDSATRIPACLVDRSNGPTVLAQGVAAGTGRAGLLRLDLVEDREGLSVAPGMLVATSGNGTLPAGLVIGTVVSAVRPGAGVDTDGHWRIEVRPLRSAEQEDSLLVVRTGQVRRQR
jgi:cell shape-determining protein MreC